jgi:hypothetical protein
MIKIVQYALPKFILSEYSRYHTRNIKGQTTDIYHSLVYLITNHTCVIYKGNFETLDHSLHNSMHPIDLVQKDRSKRKASCFSRIKSVSGCLFGTKSVNDTVAYFHCFSCRQLLQVLKVFTNVPCPMGILCRWFLKFNFVGFNYLT